MKTRAIIPGAAGILSLAFLDAALLLPEARPFSLKCRLLVDVAFVSYLLLLVAIAIPIARRRGLLPKILAVAAAGGAGGVLILVHGLILRSADPGSLALAGAGVSSLAATLILSASYLLDGLPGRARTAARLLAIVAVLFVVDYESRPRNGWDGDCRVVEADDP